MKQLKKRFEKPENNVAAFARCYSCYVNCWCRQSYTSNSQQVSQQQWQKTSNVNFSNV